MRGTIWFQTTLFNITKRYGHISINLYLIDICLILTQPFDTLDHNKMGHYRITRTALCLLRSYLSNRRQCVLLDIGKPNNFADINIGVPYGFVLDPLLFIVYSNR